MNRDSLLLFALFVVLIAVDQFLQINKSLFYAIFGVGFLAIELLGFIKYRKIINRHKDNILKLKSSDWIGAFPIAAYLIYSIYDEPLDPWLILAVLSIVAFAGIYFFKNWREIYLLNGQGIRNLNRGKEIPAQEITDTEISDRLISFHTRKYRNEIVIKSSELEDPTWDELKIRMKKLSNTWANQSKMQMPVE